MESPSLEEENRIKDVRNLLRLEKLKKKETIDTTSKGIRNLFRLEKENEKIKGRIFEVLRNITNLFDHEEEENYYKPVKASFF